MLHALLVILYLNLIKNYLYVLNIYSFFYERSQMSGFDNIQLHFFEYIL
jgi:hypothetical protein